MADNRTIVIELRNVADQTAASKTNKTAEDNSKEIVKTLKTLFHPIQTMEQQSIGRNVVVNQAVHQGLQLLKQAGSSFANYYIDKYFTLNENYNAETDFSNMMTGINKVSGFVGSIGAGMIAGASVGGPYAAVTAAIGAAAGAISWGVSEHFGAKERKLQQQITISTNNYQSQFQQTRLGLTTGRGVTNQ